MKKAAYYWVKRIFMSRGAEAAIIKVMSCNIVSKGFLNNADRVFCHCNVIFPLTKS